MAFVIPRGENGLSTPYRRIIFGLSVSDAAQSFALLVGPFSVNDTGNNPDSWGFGNETTCRVNGALLSFGSAAVPMYTCFLCWYYLCKLKLRMSDEAFMVRMELKIHFFIAFTNLSFVFMGLAMDVFHPVYNGTICYYAPVPTGCRTHPELVGECEPVIELRANTISLAHTVLFSILCLLAIIGIMISLYCQAMKSHQMVILEDPESDPEPLDVEKSSDHEEGYLSNDIGNEEKISGIHDDMVNSNVTQTKVHTVDSEKGFDVESSYASEQLQEQDGQNNNRGRLRQLSTLYKNETVLQASCYVGAYCITYIPAGIFAAIIVTDGTPSRFMQILPYLLYPLGGMFNILVYTRPQTASMRRAHPERSRLQCFWRVLKAGGELPNEAQQQHRQVVSMSDIQIGAGSREIHLEAAESDFTSVKDEDEADLSSADRHVYYNSVWQCYEVNDSSY